MKKIILSLTLFLLVVSPVFAQGQSAARSQNAAAPQADNARAEEISARIVAKLDGRVLKYQEFLTKLEAKRAELAQTDQDLTELDRLIRMAQFELNDIKVTISDLRTSLQNMDYSGGMGQVVSETVRQVNQVRDEFRQVHASFVSVVQEISRLSAN